MALPPGIHCVKRPKRSRPRTYTIKDLLRIARRVATEDGEDTVRRLLLHEFPIPGCSEVLGLIQQAQDALLVIQATLTAVIAIGSSRYSWLLRRIPAIAVILRVAGGALAAAEAVSVALDAVAAIIRETCGNATNK